MSCVVWICVSLCVLQAESYVLMTAHVDDIETLAHQALASPVMKQLKDIWRGVSQTFDSHYARFRAQEDDLENTDATYVFARKFLSPLVHKLKNIWRRASISFKKQYRAREDSGTDSSHESVGKDRRQSVERRKAMDELIQLGRNASVYLRSMKEMVERL